MKNPHDFYTARGYENINIKAQGLTASMEDYLEMITRLYQEKNHVKITELSSALNVSPSAVSNMLRKLHAKGYVKYQPYGIVYLTKNGEEVGDFLLKRHETLSVFLKLIGVKNNIHYDVERIEHNLSKETFKAFFRLAKFFQDNPTILKKYQDFNLSLEEKEY